MKKFNYLAALALLTVTTLTACGSKTNDSNNANNSATPTVEATQTPEVVEATTIEVTHSLGTVTVPVNPSKAVIFDYGILDNARALGVKAELAVVASGLPSYLSEYELNTNVGSLKEPDLEAIFAFEPEVIIISGRQSSFYEELNKIAPTVFVELDSANYLADFEKNLNLTAQIFGQEDKVETKMNLINKKVAELQELTATLEDKGLILLTNDGSMSAYGKGSRFGIIHDLFGIKTADDNIEVSTHGMEANFEYVSSVNPDIIFVVDRTEATSAETTSEVSVLDNELIQGTNAGKNSKIIKLDAEVWYKAGGGVASVVTMINEVKAAVTATAVAQ